MKSEHFLEVILKTIGEGLEKGNWQNANKAVDKLQSYRNNIGSEIIPSDRIKAGDFLLIMQIFRSLNSCVLLSGLSTICSFLQKW